MKKKVLLCFLLILFIGCTSNNLSPKWFNTKSIQYRKNEIIGYAKAKELNIAKQSAKRNIAEMLQVDVTSILNIEINSSNEKYSKKSNSKINTTTTLRLNNLKIIKQERVNNIWYVAISYDNLPLFQKIIHSTNPKRENFNNPYLKETKLFKALKDKFGFYPKAKIYAQNGQYYITIDNQQFLISQQEFIELFINNSHPNIELELKERVKNNKTYFVSTKFKRFGFASLFVVSHTGSVVGLFKNIKSTDAPLTYPNKEKYDGLRAKIDSDATHSRDMFVALLCGQKENLGLLNQVSTELERDSFRFRQLIDLMEKCAFSTRIITIYR